MSKRKAVRCTAIASDGKQCGQMTRVNRTPILCGTHYRQSQGVPPTLPYAPKAAPFDRAQSYLQLLRSRDPRVVLAAMESRDKWEERQTKVDDSFVDVVAVMNADERAAMKIAGLVMDRARARLAGSGHGLPIPGCDCALCEPLPWEPPIAIVEHVAPELDPAFRPSPESKAAHEPAESEPASEQDPHYDYFEEDEETP